MSDNYVMSAQQKLLEDIKLCCEKTGNLLVDYEKQYGVLVTGDIYIALFNTEKITASEIAKLDQVTNRYSVGENTSVDDLKMAYARSLHEHVK
jgi:hypothetical protein